MSAMLPTGTVTFLFTDIEGSSNLWERGPEAMRGALADHDAIVRDGVARHRGVVFKAIGDAFCCVFASPQDALAAAIEVQRALAAHVWPSELGALRARMGMHTGTAVEREGDYFGPTVNRVARLTAIGSGGQILASSATAALLRAALAPGTTLEDLGPHRLRDLSQSENVYQVFATGLRTDFPVLASLDALPNNLPSQFSSFVGREREIGELKNFLAAHRLVTVAGSGGIGKTRLALHVAAATIARFKDGAWFVDLSSVADPGLVVQAIAAELQVREVRLESLAETLVQHLGRKRLLLVVDNAEQVLGAVAAIVKTILSRCAGITVLATSREPLHLVGEQVYRLVSMPAAPAVECAADLTRYDSTRLFLERARSVAPGLEIADGDAAVVADVCRKLEGIPLAIELAAARVSTLSIRQLNDRLGEKLSLLASRDSTEKRHRTLRATIEWSYRLLNEGEKEALARLSICAGGFTLEACERLTPANHVPAVDVLESLVEKSFVQLDPNAEGPRYRCLDVIAEYARGELAAFNAAELVARAHARYYAELASRGRSVTGTEAPLWYRVLDDETPNLRVALDWCVANDPVLGAHLALDLSPYWRVRSTIAEARSRLTALLAAGGLDRGDRAMLLCCAAAFAAMQDDFEASLRLSGEALTIYRESGDASGTAEALFRTAEVEHRKGHLQRAKALYEEALELYGTVSNARGEMLCLANLGMLARQHGDYAGAKRLLEDAFARANASGERRIAGEFAMAIGWVNVYVGDVDRARQLFQAAFDEKRAELDRYGACGARHGLATVALKDGRLDEAFEHFAATLDAAFDLRLQDYVFRSFDGLSAVLALQGDAATAARYLGLAERLFRESGRELRDSIAYDVSREALAALLPPAALDALLAQGAALRVDETLPALRSRTQAAPPPG
jgi:predicted ATPase/class 3 adenylate cyclase